MKKTSMLLIFLSVLNFTAFAQEDYFYAIDGSRWRTQKEREAKEDSLWDKVFYNLDYIEDYDLLYDDEFNYFSYLAEFLKDVISDCRSSNEYLRLMIDNDFDLPGDKNLFISSKAKNKETFYALYLKEAFDLTIEQYNIISKYIEDVVNFDTRLSNHPAEIDRQKLSNSWKRLEEVNKVWSENSEALIKVVQLKNKK